jgi:GNAT superfamily N-acetyltransferase
MKRRGRKSAAQTPAPKSERIYGSKKNPKGSASSEKSAKQIKLSEQTIKALQNKLAEFKKNHKTKKITINDLKAVYRRGLGAYSSSHRPTITGGFPNTRNAWAMARVNKFLKKASGQKVKAAYVQDDDLIDSSNPDIRFEDGGLIAPNDVYIEIEEREQDDKDKQYNQIEVWVRAYYNTIPKNRFYMKFNGLEDTIWKNTPKGLIGIIRGYLRDNNDFLVAFMTVKPNFRRKGVNSLMIKRIREKYKLEKEKIEFFIPTHQGDLFVKSGKYDLGGLIAPNGKPSNLTAEQFKIVRTPEFKNWFGDWENDSQNASKVVDDNGEPLVVYHGSRSPFTIFDLKKGGESNTLAQVGFWFTPLRMFAYSFASNIWYGEKSFVIVYPTFLNIRNPKIYESSPERDIVYYVVENGKIYKDGLTMTEAKRLAQELNDERWLSSPHDDNDEYEVYSVSSNYEKYPDSYEKFKIDIYKLAGQTEYDANVGGLGMSLNNKKETINKYRELLKSENYDGVFIVKTRFDRGEAGGLNTQYVALYPEQIKLAGKLPFDNYEINTTFDGSNPDIRYDKGGKIDDGNANFGKPAIAYDRIPFIHETSVENAQKIIKNGFNKSPNKYITNGVYSIPIVWKNESFDKTDRTQELMIWLKEGSEIFWTNSHRPTDYYMGYGNKFYEKLYKKLNKGYKTPKDDFNDKDAQSNFSRRIENWLKENGYVGIQQGGEVVITDLDSIESIEILKRETENYAKGGKTNTMKKIEGKGDCYYIAGQFAMDNIFTPKNIDYIGTPYLVHAEVQGQGGISHIRYGHAWIEDDENVYDFSNGRELVIPKILYYTIGDINTDNPSKYRKYTFAEARRKMLDTGVYGCWDLDVEYREGGEVYAESIKKYDTGGKIPNDLRELPYYKGAYKGAEFHSMQDDEEFQKMADRWYDLMLKHQKGKKLNKKEFEEFKKLSYQLYQDTEEYARGGKTKGFPIAPNGKETNLSAEQYKLVRTPEFKAWFGDWENDRESASKVVDENGEPLVVYHGTINDFDIFNTHPSGEIGSHFGTKSQAEDRLRGQHLKSTPNGNKYADNKYILKGFLNIRNIKKIADEGQWYPSAYQEVFESLGYLTSSKSNPTADDIVTILKNKNIDGFVYKNIYEGINDENSYIIFNPNQFKIFNRIKLDKLEKQGELYNGLPYTEIDYVEVESQNRTSKDFTEDDNMWMKKGGRIWNDEELLKRYKRGESIGFSGIAHLKAQGLIKRADGTKRKSMADGGDFDVVYRGEMKPTDKNEIWVTGDEFYAKEYGQTKKYYIPKNLNILDTDLNYSLFEELVDEFGYGGDYEEYKFEPSNEFIQFLKEKGYDGFQHQTGGENILLFDKTKLKSVMAYGDIIPEVNFTPAEQDLFNIYDMQQIIKAQQTFGNGGTLNNIKIILIPDNYEKIKQDMFTLNGKGNPRLALLEDDVVIGGVFIDANEDECEFDICVKDEHRFKGYSTLLINALIKDFNENIDSEMLVCDNALLNWKDGCFTKSQAKDFMKTNKFNYKNYLNEKSPMVKDEFKNSNGDVKCVNCGWKWNTAQSDEHDKYVCHQCRFDNTLFYDTNIMNRLKKPMSVPEISSKHNVDEEYVLEQLQKGMQHEMEHTDDEQVAEIIALHHIAERPDYYEVIEEMKLSNGGNLKSEESEVEIENMEYHIPEYIQNERDFAERLMNSDETRISKAMICKAKINMATENEKMVRTGEEKNAWAEVQDIWKDCFYDVLSGDVVEYQEKECGCGCQTTTYDKGGECGCDDTPSYDKGGLAYGNSHDKGGMPLTVQSTGQSIEIEGGEGVINKRSMQMNKKLEFEGKEMTPCEIISKINEMGGGVKFKCADVKKIIAEDGNY